MILFSRDAIRALLWAALFVGLTANSELKAQAYPERTVKLISPYSGGPSDLAARLLKDRLTAIWNQPVIVETRTGGGGNIGTASVATSAPDGYTILSTASPPLVINQFLFNKLPFDPERDFAPVALGTTSPLVLVVHSSVPATNLTELIAYLKANPGKLTYASGGNGTSPHLAAEMFKNAAGVDIQHIPYRTVSEIMTSVVAGHTQIAFATPVIMEQVKSGAIRAMAQTGETRLTKLMPDVPTLKESGFPGYVAVAWYGLLVPRGTPQPIVEKIEKDVLSILKEPDVVTRLEDLAQDVVGLGQADFAKFIAAERARWGQIIKLIGVKID